ncbi:MAG: hypothetical protein L0I29_03980 [Hyphomicrobiales bacterium]|nr:hypothetical protein [Hyphomicrobiales bacterium]
MRAAERAPRGTVDRIIHTASVLAGIAVFQGLQAMTAIAQTPVPVWSYALGRLETAPESLVVVEIAKNGKFAPTEIIVPEPAGGRPRSRPFPLETNLLDMLEPRIFGSEARAAVSRDGEALVVRCRAGERPAGVILAAPDFRFPSAMRGELVVEGHGLGPFGFTLTATGQDAPDSQSTGRTTGVLASVPSDIWPKSPSPRQLVMTCPQEAAEASITAIRLSPHGRDDPPKIGTWLWDMRLWLDRPERLVSATTQQKIGEIFLQLPIEDDSVVDSAKLRRLIDALSGAGVAVHAVEGDPDMASAAGRSNALDRAAALRTFQRASKGLRSFQYDIEPYPRPDYRADPAAAWREWATTINALSAVLGNKIAVVVPFWMLGDAAAEQALQSAGKSIAAIAVMAYRTDASLIEQIASDWLDWGADHAVPISIAVENGPLPAERHRTYVRAERGDLVLDRSGSSPVAQLVPGSVTGSLTKPTYSYSHEVAVELSRISFLGNRKAMEAATARLNRNLGAWPSFGGMLVHELIGPWGEGMKTRNRSGAGEWNESKNPDLR